MKGYVKPSFSIIQLRVEEGIACSGSDCTHEHDAKPGHGGGRPGHGGGKPGHGGGRR